MTPEWVAAICAIVTVPIAVISALLAFSARNVAKRASEAAVSAEKRIARIGHEMEDFRDHLSRPLDGILLEFAKLSAELESLADKPFDREQLDSFERRCDAVWVDLRGRIRIAVAGNRIQEDHLAGLLSVDDNPYDKMFEALDQTRVEGDLAHQRRVARRFDDAVRKLTQISLSAKGRAVDDIFKRFNVV